MAWLLPLSVLRMAWLRPLSVLRMAWLLPLSVVCGCVSLVTSSCHVTSFTACNGIPFVPGHNLVGEGFDVVRLVPTGSAVVDVNTFMSGGKSGNCTMCHNALLNQTQKLPTSVKDWRIKVRCRRSLSSRVFSSSQSLLQESSNSLSSSWKVGLSLAGLAGVAVGGSHSTSATFAQSHSKSDKFSFISHKVDCEYYTFRVHSRPPLTKEFEESLHQLPSTFHHKNTSAFQHFITLYGTHYLRRVTLGGQVRSLTAVRTCQASLSKLTTRTISTCLSTEANAVIKGIKVDASTSFCTAQGKKLGRGRGFSAAFSDRSVEVVGGDSSVGGVLFDPYGAVAYQKWLHSLQTLPGLVQYHLTSLHRLVRGNPRLRSSLRAAIRHHIVASGVSLKCRSPCQTGSQDRASCSCSCHGHSLVNADCCPQAVGVARLNVTVVKGEGLWGDIFSKTDGYIKVFYGQQGATSGVIWNNDFPIWNFRMRLGSANLHSRMKVRVEVWDRDNRWNDDLLGSISFIPTAGQTKRRYRLKHGSVTVRTAAVCAPFLQGSLCETYKPTPQEQELDQGLDQDQGPDQDQGLDQGLDQDQGPDQDQKLDQGLEQVRVGVGQGSEPGSGVSFLFEFV